MIASPTAIPEVVVLEPKVWEDHRGFFLESWNHRFAAELGFGERFVQDNHSCSALGTLRGLHYQIDRPQGKLLRVVVGEVFDVAVDLRRSSATFGRWVGVRLSAANRKMLWVPPGFAHGFYATQGPADLLYKCTDFYAPEHDRTLLWNDPEIGIEWPIAPDEKPLISEKDEAGKPFSRAELYP